MATSPTHSSDGSTIFALATSGQASLAALIRVSGTRCQVIAASLLCTTQWPGAVDSPITSTLGQVPCRAWLLAGPHTLTGEDSIEMLIPGNPRLVAAIELRLLELGCRHAEPGEFTRRALNAGKLELGRAEAVCALINSQSQAERRAALADLTGESARELSRMTDTLRQLSAGFEVAFDFSEDDPDPPPFGALGAGLSSLSTALHEFCDAGQRHGPHPVPVVALFGPPNAGKSSLFNALLKTHRALVSSLPGTTRDTVRALATLDGQAVELRDLSGVGVSDSDGGRFAASSREEALQADLVLALCAPGQESELAAELALLVERDPEMPARTLWVYTKADVCQATPITGRRAQGLRVSAKSEEGIYELRSQIARALTKLFVKPASSHQRQAAALAAGVLASATRGLHNDPPEFTAGQLRVALRILDETLLAQVPGEILDSIFSRFCIGK